MSQAIPVPVDCPTCAATTNIKGDPGVAGPAGPAGSNGLSALSTIAANFVVPAVGANVVVTTDGTGWMALNQIVYAASAAKQCYMQVMALNVDGLNATLKNLGYVDYGSVGGAYSQPGDTIVANGTIGPAGIIGATGAAGADAAPIGTIAAQDANNVAITGGVIQNADISGGTVAALVNPIKVEDGGTEADNAADARTNLGLAIGTNVQAYNLYLKNLADLVKAANKLVYSTGVNTVATSDIFSPGLAFLALASASAMGNYLRAYPGYGSGLGYALAFPVNVDTVGETIINLNVSGAVGINGFNFYIIRRVVLIQEIGKAALTTAQVGVHTSGGLAVCDSQVLTTGADPDYRRYHDLTLSPGGAALYADDSAFLHFEVTTPEGSGVGTDYGTYLNIWLEVANTTED